MFVSMRNRNSYGRELRRFRSAVDAGVAGNDQYFANVKLLLPFDDADGTTTFVDRIGHTMTRTGSVAIDTAQSKFGGSSMECLGNGHYLDSTSADFTVGTADFTIEFWLRPGGVSGTRGIFDMRDALNQPRPCLYQANADVHYFVSNGNRISGGTVLSTGNWVHVAVSRVSGTTRMFFNGTSAGSWADSTTYAGTRVRLADLGDSPGTGGFIGHMDDFRLTVGTGRYSANFTPSTLPHPLS